MNKCLVVVADKVRARMLMLVPSSRPEEYGPRLEEAAEALVNPEVEVPGMEMWGETKGGRTFSGAGGPVHGYDDRREDHEDEFERRFARDISQKAVALCQARGLNKVILASEVRMLGFLRQAFKIPSNIHIQVVELAKDLTALPPQEIHTRLSEEGLLPPHAHKA